MDNIDFFSVLLIAIGLAADCFAVALSGATARRITSLFQVLRLSLSFGIFQALMLVLGWFAGQTVVELIAGFDHWVAFALLAFIGGKMLWESFHPDDKENHTADITRGFLLLSLSLATSLDALAVGLSFAFMKVSIALSSSTIGIIAFIVTAIGSLLGRRLGRIFGRRAETAGGLVLIGIGLKIILEHML